ncbi:hypothetical protein GFL03_15325 [Pseudomonas stutzeri]|jgi:hypothetical protein|nr:hypothetical protein [Stutzerimonas frequens]
MLCPRCAQGDICKARIKSSEKILYVCQECEATWFSPEAIGVETFVDYGAYMEELGLPPLWSSLVVLPD